MSGFRDFVEQVRSVTDLADVVGADVDLRSSGSCLKGLSPFHEERNPSFVVWPSTQTWHDFSDGGGAGGDVFSYVQQRDRVGFKEAVLRLASQAGLRRPDQDEEAFRRELALLVERRDVERLLTRAALYYYRVLPSRIREESYRQHYGFTDETIDGLRLGWADGHLFEHFTDELELERAAALKTGLFVLLKGGRVEDFFTDRLVFPYWKGGQVAYFIARSTQYTGDEEWERSKYKKLLTRSDRHDYVSKTVRNDTFYNEDAARGAERILITEGVTDCISAMQAGIPCISPVTTRFRKQDLPKLVRLTRWAKQVVICNDAEESGAGADGARETAGVLLGEGRDVRIATLPLPEGQTKTDVNEYLKGHPAEAFQKLLHAAPRFPEHLVLQIPPDTPKLDLSQQLRPVLELVTRCPALELDAYIDLICERFKVGRRTVKAMVKEVSSARQKEKDGSSADGGKKEDSGGVRGDAIKGEVYEDSDHYFILDREQGALVISSFSIQPVERILLETGEVIVGDVTTDQKQVHRRVHFPPAAWHSKRGFLQAMPSADMQWTGSDDNVQGLLRILSHRKVPIRKGTTTLGYLETKGGPIWVGVDLLITAGGIKRGDEVVYVSNGSTFPERVRYPVADDDTCRDTARRVLPDLLELNEPGVALPVLGWFFATPFKERIMRILEHFPILMIWGTQGSGKSTTVKEVFWRMFGVGSVDPYSVTETEFALIKLLSSTNGVPVFLDEFKPGDMPRYRLNTLLRFLRRIYGGEVEERGRANLTVTSYRLSAPVCVAGESRPDDPALVDRMVSVMPDKNRLENHPEHGQALNRLKTEDVGILAIPYIRFALSRDTEKDMAAASSITDRVLAAVGGGENVSLRCRDNLRVVVFGLMMFEAFAQHMGVSNLRELDVEAALRTSVDDLMDGEMGAKNPLDTFIESCSVLAYNGSLIPDKHYTVIDGLTCLHLRSCWEIHLEHRRRTGQPDESNGLRALRRLLRENHERDGYVKDLSKTVSMGERRPRTIAIDLQQAAEYLDVDEFPRADSRSWGGSRDGFPDYGGS